MGKKSKSSNPLEENETDSVAKDSKIEEAQTLAPGKEERRKLNLDDITSVEMFDFRYLFGYLPISDWEFQMAERFKLRFSLAECKELYRLFEYYRVKYDLDDDETLALRVFRRYLSSEFYREEKMEEYMDECEYYIKLFLYGRLMPGRICMGEEVRKKEVLKIENLVANMAKQEGRKMDPGRADAKDDLFSSMFELKEGFPGRADDVVILRFLRMTFNNVADTETAIRDTIEWRRKYKPHLIMKPSIELDGRTAKAFWHGQDKEGHPCLHVYPGRATPSKEPVEGTVRFAVWLFEVGLRLVTDAGVDQIVVLYDRDGFGFSNWSTSLALELMKLQPHYPESLNKIFVLGANWVYYVGLKIIKPVMPVRTLQKITLLSKQEELLEYFTPENLLPRHGGTSSFEYDWDTYMDDYLNNYKLPWQTWHEQKKNGTLVLPELESVDLEALHRDD